MNKIRIGLIGDFDPKIKAHQAIPQAIQLAAGSDQIEAVWVATDTIQNTAALSTFNAIWCVPGSPYNNMDGALIAIRFARETGRPFLGTCGGFQHAMLEYARNVLGLHSADHAESSPEADFRLIAPLVCSLVGQSGEIILLEGTRLKEIYCADRIVEGYHCSYGLNPVYENLFEGTPLHVSGRDSEGQIRSVELVDHPFFFATLFQPERSAFEGKIHPLIKAYLHAACQN